MSNEYEWLALDLVVDPMCAYGYTHRPEWDGDDCFDFGWSKKVMQYPDWLLPGQLWQRGEDDDNSGCKYVFDGSHWSLVEDYSVEINGKPCHEYYDCMVVPEKRGTILDEAKTIINGERQDQYGSPEDSFSMIAKYWSLWLGADVSKKDVAAMMVLFKMARQQNQHKRDNLTDAAGYLGILGDME